MKNRVTRIVRSVVEWVRPARRVQPEPCITPEQLQKTLAQMLADPGTRKLFLRSLAGTVLPIAGGACPTDPATIKGGIFGDTCTGGEERAYTFSPEAAGTVPLSVKGFSMQTANLQQWKDSAGIVLASVTSGGSLVFKGTATKQGMGGPELISAIHTAQDNVILYAGLSTDTEGRFLISARGFLEWGGGGTSDQDIALSREVAGNISIQSHSGTNSDKTFLVNRATTGPGAGAEVLRVDTTNSCVHVTGIAGQTGLRVKQAGPSDRAFGTFATGDDQLRFVINADGALSWGQGGMVPTDTSLFRSAADTLRTPDKLIVDDKVGIGTTGPGAQLHVKGAGQATNSPNPTGSMGGALILQDTGTSVNNGGFLVFGAGQGFFAGIKGLIIDGSVNTGGDLIFTTRTSDLATLQERMRIMADGTVSIGSGKVGIGTTGPGAQLHVKGAGQATNSPNPTGSMGGALILQDTGTSVNNGGFLVFGAGQGFFAGIKGLIIDGSVNTGGDLIFTTRTSDLATLQERMRIMADGTVGIGIPSPNFVLHTSGAAVALGAPPSPPTDANLNNSNISFFLDQSMNKLKVRVKYSDGTLKTATIAFDP